MIIDAHAHLGHDYVFDEEENEEELIYWYNLHGIDGAIVQPFLNRPYMEDTVSIHDRIYAFCSQHPGRFYGMASINPHFKPEEYEKEAGRCIKDLGFVGIKLTPYGHAVNPSTADGMHVFEVASSLNVPVMVHTGAGAPFADPISLVAAVEKFRSIPIVLAHAGTDMFFQQALYLARNFDNVYLEPSWLSILNVRKALKTVGAGKLMFSSDHGVNVPVELAKYRTLLEDGEELQRILGGTAAEVFNLNKI